MATTERVAVLDHGYIEAIENWGSDERIIEAARMSTGKGFKGWGRLVCSCGAISQSARFTDSALASETPRPRPFIDDKMTVCPTERGGRHVTDGLPTDGDERLLRFLWENKHQTPFEMAGLTIEVQAPIFVFREWHRHRVPFGYNEMSARYTPLPDVNYIPSLERLLVGSDGKNRQAGTVAGAEAIDEQKARDFQAALMRIYSDAEHIYQAALTMGVPKELARVHLPVGRYSRMRATSNLRGWLGFLALRMAPGAQWEIRQYANAVGALIADRFPRTWALFAEGTGR
ncbi:MAG: FAD-dependent thymidylate synthase [Phenylobacterium sp.]|uniref:FAD-dependent thymidylate synthase n=1 Tax=Phenylobacterium sp. TaxID=1871053 RepID=UPI0012170078|nr:FAD-dependent thymidylate synthase [Phenylobacterium sp.]TAL28982.1 MAG: FAD-dependent thymidylate synthase [Phenylobacterium sp.]